MGPLTQRIGEGAAAAARHSRREERAGPLRLVRLVLSAHLGGWQAGGPAATPSGSKSAKSRCGAVPWAAGCNKGCNKQDQQAG